MQWNEDGNIRGLFLITVQLQTFDYHTKSLTTMPYDIVCFVAVLDHSGSHQVVRGVHQDSTYRL